jgi:hypothetical protein
MTAILSTGTCAMGINSAADDNKINKKVRRILKIVETKPTTTEVINVVVSKPQNQILPVIAPTSPTTAITTDYCDASLFEQKQIQRNITVPFYKISRTKNISEILNRELSNMLEGKCSIEGYICPGSINITQHSCGRLHGGNIIFDVDLKCLVCLPNEHTKIACVAKTITQAGIRAVAKGLEPGSVSPIEVFISRDMNMNIKNAADMFIRVKEGDLLVVEIIGRRFVLNDTHVTIIAILQEVTESSI